MLTIVCAEAIAIDRSLYKAVRIGPAGKSPKQRQHAIASLAVVVPAKPSKIDLRQTIERSCPPTDLGRSKKAFLKQECLCRACHSSIGWKNYCESDFGSISPEKTFSNLDYSPLPNNASIRSQIAGSGHLHETLCIKEKIG